MAKEQRLNERWERIRRSVALEQPDRIPVVLEYAGFAAHVTHTPMAEFLGLMGDVPAVMLFMASPDEVYDYCTRLTRELGPTGFILQSGCDIPTNAKRENVRAMVSAALDSRS